MRSIKFDQLGHKPVVRERPPVMAAGSGSWRPGHGAEEVPADGPVATSDGGATQVASASSAPRPSTIPPAR